VLRLRVLSAGLGAPVLLGLTVLGGIPYLILIAVGVILASYEMLSMIAGAGFRPLRALGVAVSTAVILSALDVRVLPPLLVITSLGSLFWLMRREVTEGALADWAFTFAPALYIGIGMYFTIPLRSTPDGNGLFWVLAVMVSTWACDITAFFVGRRWGRRRLAPRISPGKSVEGAVAGVLLTAVICAALGPLLTLILTATGLGMGQQPALLRMAGLGLVVGVCAVSGDLLESFIKRQCGAKDASALIPGHGGILDRMDSLLVAAVGAYFYVVTTA
jgi:phosphatidate cytidylyltransferase